jgi:L-alanine-DL-glutamate epimerase-like enolase superfamily enzyme
MCIPNTEFFEVLLPEEAQKYGLLEEIEIDARGMVRAPDKPGLGAEIDFGLIKANEVAVLR